MKLLWFDKAIYDLRELYNYYYIKSPSVALKYKNSIFEETERLTKNPFIGAIEREISTIEREIRALVVLNGLYKVIYTVREDSIEVYRIWACRKNPNDLKI
ncbi:type II toxin-antitoxin system RelE/ParE family toxin [Bacteroides sp. OttesenSCG-928-D19]|nr:type II toxin-antitoxin system RelE/ParE family toxin [Bacteroides sp. OttesenSCG-928-N06]MDL2306065.1 type II toxin-antitoxin system RelE/ParE family toxin [Bacteroides sp. OttesenSCG-928-D19]